MKRNIIEKTVAIFIFTLLCATAGAQDNDGIQSFVDSFKVAVEDKNITSINAMNSWEGVPEELRATIEEQFKEIVEKGILNIELEYIEQGMEVKFSRGEVAFAPNVSPVAKVNIEIPTGKTFRGGYSFYIGKEDRNYVFSHVVRQ